MEDKRQHLILWLNQHIWPQIHAMMLYDAYFRLLGRARELTGEFSGPIGAFIETGYVTSQTIAIRRLCDGRKDVISLRRLLVEANTSGLIIADQFAQLSSKLGGCEPICGMVNDYVAHTANPLRRPNMSEWKLQVGQLQSAQRAICEIAITFERDLLQQPSHVTIIPVPQFDIMQEFKPWVPASEIAKLWDFWHAHNKSVNAWISPGWVAIEQMR